jgi:NAD(P)-dependent dehydrogenase (short-subunit alcohol dehydrogenase family)
MNIEGAVALVSGGDKGIGNELVKALQKAGAAKIYASSRHADSLAEVVSLDPERIIPIELDISDDKSVTDAAAQCQDVTLLINNAGVGFDAGLIAAPDLSHAKTEMEVNYFGTLRMCRAFAPILKTNGGGAIVNILSSLALVNLPVRGSYSASKAAALSMTQGVRAELAAQGTLVVAVLPGTVDTDFSKDYDKPKTAPAEVAAAALQAVIDGVEDVYPGDEAQWAISQLISDPKGLEKQLAQILPAS